MNNQRKKLLVLGGASQHCKVVECAHRLGIEVYVADYLEHSPAKEIADHCYLIDVMDIDKLVELCISEKIDGAIVTSLDACQIPYQRLCARMKFPCFGTEDQYKKLTSKNSFKDLCRKFDVDVIPEYTIDDIKNNNSIVKYPVFVKPSNSRSSRGQQICYNLLDTLQAIEKAKEESLSGEVIIEQYMEGYQDFTVSYLILDGNPIVVRTGDRYEGTDESGLTNLAVASLSPSAFHELYFNNVARKVENMLRSMQLKYAPVFMQGFIDNNTIRFYDPGLRFAGGEYERVVYSTMGIDIIKPLVLFALGIQNKDEIINYNEAYKLAGKRLIQLDPTLQPGVIQRIEGLDKIDAHDSVYAITTRYSKGDIVPKSGDVRQRFGEFCIVSSSIEEEKENIAFVQENLHVLDEDGKNMIIDKFDTKRIAIATVEE